MLPTNVRMAKTVSVPLASVKRDPALWPRHALNQARIDLFAELYGEGGPSALPPIEVVLVGETFLLVEGWHRVQAAERMNLSELPALAQTLPDGLTPRQYAYQRGLEAASTSALPLTREERQYAVIRLLEERRDLSRREIARLVGLSHDTVNRIARGMDETSSPTEGDGDPKPTRQYVSLLIHHLERAETNLEGRRFLIFDNRANHVRDLIAHRHDPAAIARLVLVWAEALKEGAQAVLADVT